MILAGRILTAVLCLLFSICLQSSLHAQVPESIAFENINVWPQETPLNSFIQVIQDDLGYLWMTSSMGLHRYDGEKVQTYYFRGDSNALPENYTEMIFLDHHGQIWIGTVRGAICRYRRATDDFEQIAPIGSICGHVSGMTEDKSGGLWLAAANGVFQLDPQTNALTGFIPDTPPADPRGYGFRAIINDMQDEQYLWVAGLDGAYHFHIRSGRFFPLPPSIDDHHSYMVMDLHQETDGHLWGGSWFGGILEYDPGTSDWKSYLPPGVLPQSPLTVTKAILPFSPGFWFASSGGFGFMDDTGNFTLLSAMSSRDGITRSSNYGGILLTKNNNLVITRSNGFSISSSVSGSAEIINFSPQLRAIEVNESELPVSKSQNVVLHEEEKDIAFRFCLPGYFGNSTPAFQYRLDGYDKAWHDASGRQARYTNVPFGRYTFQYRVSIDGEQWVSGDARPILKKVAFTSRPVFFGLLMAILIACTFIYYRIRMHQSRLKAEFNRKLNEVEMAALRAQMNPHFIFNSLNSIKYYILNEETDQANKYLNKFSKLMRLVLKNSQSRLVNLADELEALTLYIELESLRFHHAFHYQISVDPVLDQEDTFIPPLIIQPFVENAIWHGLLHKKDVGELKIDIRKVHTSLHVDIADDGVGRAKAREMGSKSATQKSFGTSITRNRIALVREALGINASVEIEDLTAENGEPAGTRVHLELPLLSGAAVSKFEVT